MVRYVVFFDLETTGIRPPIRITQIGALACVLNEELTETQEFSQFVNPEQPIEPEAERITGLTWVGLQSEPIIKEVLPNFLRFLNSLPNLEDPSYLVAHSGKRYDFKILKNEMDRSAEPYEAGNLVYVDSIDVFRNYSTTLERGEWSSYRLDAVSERLLGTSRTGEHDALSDCKILRNCCKKLGNHLVTFLTTQEL